MCNLWCAAVAALSAGELFPFHSYEHEVRKGLHISLLSAAVAVAKVPLSQQLLSVIARVSSVFIFSLIFLNSLSKGSSERRAHVGSTTPLVEGRLFFLDASVAQASSPTCSLPCREGVLGNRGGEAPLVYRLPEMMQGGSQLV